MAYADLEWASERELIGAARACAQLIAAMQGLALSGQTVPGLLIGAGAATHWTHYPADDAHDPASGFRYYYHVHPRTRHPEHGHFHVFHHGRGQAQPTHLLGAAVDRLGMPVRVFATNRWVTDEQVQPATRVWQRLRRLHMTRPPRLQPVHDWIAALALAFAPQIRALLAERDERIRTGRAGLLEDRRIAVLSARRISLHRQARWIDRLLPPAASGE